VISLGAATYDPEDRRMASPNGIERLTPCEHAILMCLVQRRGKMIRHDTVIGALWEPDDEPEWARDAMKVHLCRLRAKLKAVGAATTIDNVWGAGYVLSEH
jgi:DNA-binding response OmpR family regulator